MVVHNLGRVNWYNSGGTEETEAFDKFIKHAVLEKDYNTVTNYKEYEHAKYAVPRAGHFYPLLYVLGASDATVFNEYYTMGSLIMTSYLFED